MVGGEGRIAEDEARDGLLVKSLGQIAYEAYAAAFPGPAGRLAFAWERLSEDVRAAWEAAAKAARLA